MTNEKTQKRTLSPFEETLVPLTSYGLPGLKPGQIKMFSSQPERMFESAMQLQAAQRMAGEKQSPLRELLGHTMRPVGHGLMAVLEYADRPQDAAFAVIDEMLEGGTDWNKMWARAKENLKGEDQTGFVEILDHLPAGMKQGMADALVPFADSIQRGVKSTFGKPLGPEMLPNWENARKIYGTAGDLTVDPWNFLGLPALKLRKAARLARAAGQFTAGAKLKFAAGAVLDPLQTGIETAAGAVRLGGRAAMKSDTIEDFARATFMHGTGDKDMDALITATGSKRGWIETDLFEKSKAAMDTMKPLAKGYENGSRVFRLAEERPFAPVFRDDTGFHIIPPDERAAFNAKQAAALLDRIEGLQRGDPNAVLGLVADYKNFANPKNMEWWVKNYKPEDRGAVLQALTATRDMLDTRQAMRQATGMRTPELYDQPIRNYNLASAAVAKAYKNAAKEEAIAFGTKMRVVKNLVAGKEQAARKLVGAKLYKEVLTAYHATPDVKLLRASFKDIYKRRVTDLLGDIETKNLTALEELQERAIRGHLTELGEQELIEKLATNRSFQQLVQDQSNKAAAVSMLPAYVPHVVTPEAARALAKTTEGGRGLRNALLDPNMANDITRKFVDNNGIPLSLEQIQNVHKARGLSSITTTPKIRSRADIDLIEPSIVYQDKSAGKKINRFFGKGDEPKIAEFFDVDPAAVFAITSQRTARSITAAEFTKGLIDQEYILKEIPPLPETGKPNEAWVPLSEVKSLSQMTQRFPELNGYYVTKLGAKHIARVADPYFGQLVSHPVVAAYDLWKRWFISYTLPIWPATQTRNKLGSFIGLNYGGMFDNPLTFGDDAYQYLKGNTGQALMMMGNTRKAEGIKVHIKAFGAHNETPYPEFMKLALKHGVANADYYGSEVRDLMSLSSPWKNWKAYTPGSNDFGLVKGGRAVMRWADQGDRSTLFMHYLEKGYQPEEAAALTKKYLGNFSREYLTPFERSIMTRVFPFYRWTRYNMPLTFDQLLFSPMSRYKLTALRRVHEELLEPESEQGGRVRAWTPSFLRQVGGIPIDFDEKTGEMKFMALEGYIPAADIGNWLGAYDTANWALAQLTPPLATIIEAGMNQAIFSGEKFEGKREMFGKQFPAFMVHMMRKFRFLSELDRLDPFGTFHTAGKGPHPGRKLQPLEERLLKFIGGAGIYRTTPMRHIIEKNEEWIERMRKDAGYLRAPSYNQNIGEWKHPEDKASQLLRKVEEYDDENRKANGYPVDTTEVNQAPLRSIMDKYNW